MSSNQHPLKFISTRCPHWLSVFEKRPAVYVGNKKKWYRLVDKQLNPGTSSIAVDGARGLLYLGGSFVSEEKKSSTVNLMAELADIKTNVKKNMKEAEKIARLPKTMMKYSKVSERSKRSEQQVGFISVSSLTSISEMEKIWTSDSQDNSCIPSKMTISENGDLYSAFKNLVRRRDSFFLRFFE